MTHPALKPRIVYDGTVTGGYSPHRVLIEGGLRYRDANDNEQSAWVGGYWGPGGTPQKPAPWSSRWQTFDNERLRAFARSITAPILIINVEHYGIDQIGKLVDIIETIRDERPDIAIMVWSLLPSSDFWAVQNHVQVLDYFDGRPHFAQSEGWWKAVQTQRIAAFARWQDANRLVAAKLLPHVDGLAPSIYPVIDPSPDLSWTAARNAEVQIEEAVTLAKGKPVYPVYQPWVPKSATAPAREASASLTSAVCGAVKQSQAAGMIIWSEAIFGKQGVPEAFALADRTLASSLNTMEQPQN